AGGRFFGGSGSRSLAERRVEAAREEIKQLERDRRDYYHLLARQQIPDAVHSDMAALGGRPQGDTPTRPQARPSGARFAREIEDQITRTRDAVARLISESEIAAAREYALQMQELDRLFFDL